MAHQFTDANFDSDVLKSDKVTLIDFWAEWCGPCKIMSPVVEELAQEFEGKAVIGKMDVDNNPEVPFKYRISGIPTFLLFKNGELKQKIVGATTKKALADAITAQL
ncbi:MAG: thioredoxin [Saprospiraceae bacterium]